MKIILIRNLLAIALFGLFAQGALAQDMNAGAALKEIADIVVSINHFPSDEDKAALAPIAANESYPQGVRDMATTVAGIEHAANAEGKAAMARIQASAEAPDRAKALAAMIAGFNHMLGDEQKATLAELYP